MSGEAPRFDTAIVVQKVIDVPANDRTGKPDLNDDANWETYITRQMEYMPLTGKERLYGGQTTSDVTHRITCRDDPETRLITPKNRLTVGGTKHGITSIIRTRDKTSAKKRIIEIMAIEKTT